MCTNHYKISALMSLRSRENIQDNYTSTCSDSCTHVGPPQLFTGSSYSRRSTYTVKVYVFVRVPVCEWP